MLTTSLPFENSVLKKEIESLPEKETGLYQRPKDWLKDYMKTRVEEGYGYYFFEEYALWKDKMIARQEYDDGSAMIEGKPVRVTGAELRLRYLTAFNFVLCGGDHVLNNDDPNIDIEFSKLMDAILLRRKTVTDLVSFVDDLPSPRHFGR